METQKRKIEWIVSLKKFATGAWGFGTYFALLIGAGWLAVATGGQNAWQIAFGAVSFTTTVNFIGFMAIEHTSNRR